MLERQKIALDLYTLSRRALQAVRGDRDAAQAIRDAARKLQAATGDASKDDFALLQRQARRVRTRVDELTTPALQTAYNHLLDVCADPKLTAKAIERATEAAIEEKSRYVAERIARTESARAWFDGFLAGTINDDDVWGYRWVLSSRHWLVGVDECDVCANMDVGYGRGVYPKARCPAIPLHPHCMCSLVEVVDGEVAAQGKPMNPGGAREYLDSLSDKERRQLFGVKGAARYARGDDWQPLLRGWRGFRTPKGRLSAADFKTGNDNLSLQLFAGDRLPEGEYNFKIRRQVVNRHFYGNAEFNQYVDNLATQGSPYQPSYFAEGIDLEAVQQLIDDYHGKGQYKPGKNGEQRENVRLDHVVGKTWNYTRKEYIDTDCFRIVYSAKGVHAFPVEPIDMEVTRK